MSALDIIEQIKALSDDDKKTVIAFVDQLKTESTESTAIDDDAFKAVVDKVFAKHANLMERLAQ